jgi:hypothetical protein
MSKLKGTIRSGYIQIALATGISIIVLAYVSKRVLPQPIGYLHLAIPPFIMVIYTAVVGNEKFTRFCKTPYWIAAIFIATLLIIVLNA